MAKHTFTVTNILFAVAIVGLIGAVNSMDMDNEIMEAKEYCTNVEQGVWPDYEQKYDLICQK